MNIQFYPAFSALTTMEPQGLIVLKKTERNPYLACIRVRYDRGMLHESTQTETLIEFRPGKVYTSSILKIASCFWAVKQSTLVRDLAEAFRNQSGLPVVAVVDEDGKARGIVRMDRLFEMLGKPFGLEILGKARVDEICEDVLHWPGGAELFSVAEDALKDATAQQLQWYILDDEDGCFAGIFSAHDLASYLSTITQEDVEYAGRLQERLIAGHENLAGAGWNFEGWSRSAKGIGGDLYFANSFSDDEAFFCLSDISGKGVSASVLVSMAYGMLRMHDHNKGLKHLILKLNSAVVEAFHLEKYLTGIFMTWNGATNRVTLADMGHSHILVFRDGKPGRFKTLKTNLPIGIEQDIEPVLNQFQLKAGDVVFVHSDGFTEQENSQGTEFGEKRLRDTVARCLKDGTPIAQVLPEAFDRFRGPVPLQDDASFMALHIN